MKKILFIDNSKPIRLLLNNILKNDYEVYAASSSSEAFQYIFEIEMPDLIIIDPSENEADKLNDNRFIQFLKSSVLFKHIQIIVLSKDITGLEEYMHTKIVNLVVEKPFDPIKLRRSISALLAS